MASPLSSWPEILERVGPSVRALLPSGPVLAAVSGGADSLALLQILVASGCAAVVGHVNHQLRGRHSDGDEDYVRALCASLGVPFEVRRVQVLGASNIEAQARQLRYAALEEMALAYNCHAIATGHTASDVLETILLHWLRGATVTGMRGIEASRVLRPGAEIRLVRPLLDITRAECEAVCEAAGWQWREDASNGDPKYLRNRVRQELVPLLANMMDARGSQQGARERVARQSVRAAKLWADDLDFLDDLATQQLDALCTRRAHGLMVLDGDKFVLLPVPVQRRVLKLGAQRVAQQIAGGVDCESVAPEISSHKIEEARLWIGSGGPRRVWQWQKNLSVEWCGAGSGNRIRLRRVEVGATQ
jgi:tRNA(Ile)-lysidine synthase